MTQSVDLHYEVDGSPGDPAVILGGSLGTTLEMWEPQRGVFGGARVICPDHRGHGRSPVPPGPYAIADLGGDVMALADRLGVERFSYCGVSIGGMVGQWLAINAPARVERMILICTAAHVPGASTFHQRAATVRSAGTAEVVAETVVERWFTPDFATAHPDVVARHRAMIASTPAEGYAACAEAVADFDVRGGLEGVRAATLVVAAAQDLSLPPELGRAIADAVPGAHFALLEPAAHLASVERAAEVNRLIAEHLNLEAGT
jgi:3-oxoadipate enol-lactonase